MTNNIIYKYINIYERSNYYKNYRKIMIYINIIKSIDVIEYNLYGIKHD